MFVKKFEAASLEQALARVKEEFGPGALVLSTNSKKGGLFQRGYVEVTAAVGDQAGEERASSDERTWDQNRHQPNPPARRSDSTLVYRKNFVPPESAVVSTAKRQVPDKRTKYIDIDPLESTPTRGRSHQRLEQDWIDLGFRVETSKEFAGRLLVDFSHEDLRNPNFVQRARGKLLGESLRTVFPETFDGSRRWLFCGGPGAGKTSGAVKVALHLRRTGREVALCSLDSRKVVGSRELERYARLLEIPYLKPDQARVDKRIVLFDSHWDTPQNVRQLAEENGIDSVLAVVDARERFAEAYALLRDLHRELPLAAVAFTRLDLAQTRGFVFDVLRALKVPFFGASLSISFKSPFKFFEPTELAQFLLKKEAV